MGKFSKVYVWGDAVIQLSGSGCTGFSYSVQGTLQTNDKAILSNVKVNCNSQTNSEGFFFGGAGTQQVTYSIGANGCTTAGMELQGTQFTEHYNDRFWNDYVGVYLHTLVAAGGANSNSFYGLTITNGTVGILLADDGGATLGMNTNVFVNANILSNAVAEIADFQSWPASVTTFIGGSTEATGSTSTVTINGHVINNASIFMSGPATMYLNNFANSEATITPWAKLTNTSSLVLTDSYGYGNGSGVWANTDATSTLVIEGKFVNPTGAALLSGSGTIGNTVVYGNLNSIATTVSGLPAAAAGNKGWMKVVSDSTSVATEGQTCVGSSTNTALAFSNGTVWKCF
jgi:hypothetical protein